MSQRKTVQPIRNLSSLTPPLIRLSLHFDDGLGYLKKFLAKLRGESLKIENK